VLHEEQNKEIIKTMFQCDLTRVVSFTFGYGNNAVHFKNVFSAPQSAGKYLDLSGNPISNPTATTIFRTA
jgi:hypothetical protein